MARVCCLLGFQLGEGDAGLVGLHFHVVISLRSRSFMHGACQSKTAPRETTFVCQEKKKKNRLHHFASIQ